MVSGRWVYESTVDLIKQKTPVSMSGSTVIDSFPDESDAALKVWKKTGDFFSGIVAVWLRMLWQ